MRFSIRDLMWLTVVVAIGCCWYGSYRRWSHLLEWSEWESHVNWLMYKDLQEHVEHKKRRGEFTGTLYVRGSHEEVRQGLKADFRQHRGWPSDANNYIAELGKEVEDYEMDYSVLWELLDDKQKPIAATKVTEPKYVRTGRLP